MILVVIAAVAIGAIAVSSFLNVKPAAEEPAQKKQKKPKLTKGEKIAQKAAAISKKSTAVVEQDIEQANAKAEKKRAKEKERKLRRAAETKQAAEDAARAEKEAAAMEAKMAAAVPEDGGKKKKKKGKKNKKTEESAAVAEPAPVAEPVDDGWVTIEKKEKAAPIDDPSVATAAAAAAEFKDDIMIEQEHFKVVIGPKGSTLKKICEATSTQIKLPNRGFRDRTWISGDSKANVAAAKKALEQLVAKGYCDITAPGRVDDGIEIPDKKMFGVIMGKGGSTIALLQRETETDIKLPDRDSDSNFIKVLGDAPNVARAIQALKELMEQGYSSVTHEGWVSKAVQVPRDQLSNIIGPQGSIIREMEATTKCKIQIPSNTRSDPIEVMVQGEATNIEEAVLAIASKIVMVVDEEIPEEWTREAVMNMQMVF